MTAPILPADDPETLDRAALLLKAGELVAMPTETVYGLAADASNGEAVARLYEAKGRPRFNPLIAHVAGPVMARKEVEWPDLAERLATRFWPGPLTLVLPRKAGGSVSDLAAAGLDTLAVRMPDHPAAQMLITAHGRPLVAPSANPSGKLSPTTAAHVAEGLGGKLALIIDGGACRAGVESTVIAIDGDTATLLRPGALPRAEIEAITGPLAQAGEAGAPQSPGMLASHYAPEATLRLNAEAPQPGERYLGFGGAHTSGEANLSHTGDLVEAAANLFALLRELDAAGADRIAVAPIPFEALGEAINDRLARAAAPRD
jgi:L-threonylcarbamoyladenylate synthase